MTKNWYLKKKSVSNLAIVALFAASGFVVQVSGATSASALTAPTTQTTVLSPTNPSSQSGLTSINAPQAFIGGADTSTYYHVPDGHLDITFDDLNYILDQIKFGEAHAKRTATSLPNLNADSYTATIVYPYDQTTNQRCLIPNDLITASDGSYGLTGLSNAYTFNNLQPWGVRQVDGLCNNITNVQPQTVPTDVYQKSDLINGSSTDHWGAADLPFARMTPATNDPSHPNPVDTTTGTTYYRNSSIPLSPAQLAYETPTANVSDPTPRIISNLISDQSTDNPAALAAAQYSFSSLNPTISPVTPELENSVNATTGAVTPVYEIPNVTPDYNVSAGYNSWFTLFGQFFDHGLDLIPKAGASVYIPLQGTDPLYIASPYSPNFMVLTRGADATGNSMNITTPYVDQSQTYGSHPSQNFFIREYTFDTTTGVPHSTGKLLEGTDVSFDTLPTSWTTSNHIGGTLNFPTGGVDSTNHGLPTWKVMKAQALLLGIKLTDYDVVDVPVVATDQYGKFIADPVTGFPMVLMHSSDGKYMWRSGTPENPIGTGVATPDNPTGGISFPDLNLDGVTWRAVGTGHPFLNDTMNSAVPLGHSGQPLRPDADSVMNSAKTVASGFYDNENLDSHYIAGDARVNENIGLSAIHGVFHGEHNLVAQDIYDFIHSSDPRITDVVFDEWNNPERIYQAARLVMEMEYQHMAYDEFIRRIAPNLPPFVTYNPNYNASITAEFASAVYRLGHSMLNETIARSNPGSMYDPTSNQDVTLLQAFTNPAQVRLVKPAIIESAAASTVDTTTSIIYTLKAGEAAPAVGAVVSIENMANSAFNILNAVVDSYDTTSAQATFTIHSYYAGGASISPTDLSAISGSTNAKTAVDPNTQVAYSIADVSISDPGTNGFNYTPPQSAASIAQGMSAQRGNEVDEFVTDAVRNNLLGLPLDLASLNITRGRETGLPTLNQFRSQFAANLPVYTSWNNYISHLRYAASGVNFVAAYGTHESLTAQVNIGTISNAVSSITSGSNISITFTVDTVTVRVGDVININGYAPGSTFDFSASSHKFAVVKSIGDHSFTVTSHLAHGPSEIVSYATSGELMAGSQPISEVGAAESDTSTASVLRDMTIAERRGAAAALLNSTSQDAIDFLNHSGTWANRETGIDYVDLWNGGLAENPAKQPNLPGLLGPTFQYVFQDQTLNLQDGDRFYYLGRIVGVDLGDTIPAQKFTDIVRRNTTSRSVEIPGGLGIIGMQSPGFSISDCAFSDNPALLNEATRCPDSSMTTTPLGITHSGLDNVTGFVDPLNTSGARLVGGDGDDSLLGGPGNDYLDGGASGGDLLAGFGGDDILIGGPGDDLLEGGPGNDVIDAGEAQVGDISDGGSGNDWLTCDNCNLIIPSQLGESGDDFIQAGRAIDTLTMGGEGNDWIEGMGGDDVQLSGDDNVGGGVNFQVQLAGGNDVVIGGAGFDTTFGDGGDDIFPAGDAWDQIDGNEGFDWVTYEGTSRFDNGQTVLPATFADLTLAQTPVTSTQTDVLINVEGLSGSSGNDILIGGLGQDIVEPNVTGNQGARTLYIPGTITTIVDGMAVSGQGIAPNTFVFGKPSTVIAGAVNGVGGTTQTVVQLTGSITGDITQGVITFSMQPIDDVNFMANLPALTAHTPGNSAHAKGQATLVIDTRNRGRGRGVTTTYTLNNFNYSGDSRISVGGVVRLTPLTGTTPLYTGNVASATNGGRTLTVTGWDVTPDSSTSNTKFVVDYGFATTKWAGGYIVTGGDGNDETELMAGSNIVHGSYSLHVCLQVRNGAFTEGADVDCGNDGAVPSHKTRGYSSMSALNTPMVQGRITVSDVKVVRELVPTNASVTAVSSNGITATYKVSKKFIVGDKLTVKGATASIWDINNAAISSASQSAPYTVTVPVVHTTVANLTTDKQAIITAVSHANGSPLVTYTAANRYALNQHLNITGFTGNTAGFNIADAVITAVSATEFTVSNPLAPTTDASITDASYNAGARTMTYTAVNSFTPGQRVTITGLSNTRFNLSRVTIATASATDFTVTGVNINCGTISNCAAVSNSSTGKATATVGAGNARARLTASVSDIQLLIPRGNSILVGMQLSDTGTGSVPANDTVTSVTSLGNAGWALTLSKNFNISGQTINFSVPTVSNLTIAAVAKNTDVVTEPYASSNYNITAASSADISANNASSGYVIYDLINQITDTVYDVEMIKFGCTDLITCSTRNATPIVVGNGNANTPPTLIPSDDAALRTATVGIAYRQDFIVGGTPTPTSITLAAGSLPPGLSLSALGVISGTPSTAGSWAFSVTTTTSSGTYTTPIYTMVVGNLSLPVIAYSGYAAFVQQNSVFPGAIVTSTGGDVFSYAISPALPTGMSIDPATGRISGRPTVVVPTTTYTVTASNPTGSATADFIFEVKPIGASAGVAIAAGYKHVGDTLTANTSSTTGTGPFTFTYQWQTGFSTGTAPAPVVWSWTNIDSATAETYVLQPSDTGSYLRVIVTATNAVSTTGATSNSVGPIYGPGLPPTAMVSILGEPFIGRTFTADTSLSINVDGSTSYTYQWSTSTSLNGTFSPIVGATNSTYTSNNVFDGYLKVEVTEVTAAGISVGSAITGPLAALAPTAAVQVTNNASCSPNPDNCSYVGLALTAVPTLTQGSAVTFTYVWAATAVNAAKTAAYTAIRAQTSATYTPVAADLNKYIRAQITATNALGISTVYSQPIKITQGTLPIGTVPTPTVSGTPTLGNVLTLSPGTWSGFVLAYQWLRNGTAISRATALTYTLVAADVGTTISARVTATRIGYQTYVVTSAGVPVIGATFTSTTNPVITGSATLGSRLTATLAAWSPTATFTYAWWRTCVINGSPVTTATGGTTNAYTITTSDIGCGVFVKSVGSRSGYTSVTVTSALTSDVTAQTQILTGSPTVTGALNVGTLLRAVPGTWDAGTTQTYAWYRGANALGTRVSTASSYTPVAADLNSALTLVVTSTRVGYYPVTAQFTTNAISAGTIANHPTPTIAVTGAPAPALGTTLALSLGVWDTGVTYGYQWYRYDPSTTNSSLIATSSTYVVTSSDLGLEIYVVVTGSKPGFTPYPATSAHLVIPA